MQPIIEETTEQMPADRQAIAAALMAFNTAKRPTDLGSYVVRLRTAEGETIGGLAAHYYYDWLHVEILALPEESRGQGLGTKLIKLAEEHARSKGCIGVWLDTFEHQAPKFYEKLGYTEFGRIEGHPIGSRRYFFMKRF